MGSTRESGNSAMETAMTADAPINLANARKAKAHAASKEQAARNRVVHGRGKAEKAAEAEARRRTDLRLDGARRDP